MRRPEVEGFQEALEALRRNGVAELRELRQLPGPHPLRLAEELAESALPAPT